MTASTHKRPCANCRHVGPLRKDWRWCCWNPIGCECAEDNAETRTTALADDGERRTVRRQGLWELVLAEVDRIERKEGRKGNRSVGYHGPRDESVLTILDIAQPDGTGHVYRIEAMAGNRLTRAQPTVRVRRYYHSAEPYWEERIASDAVEPERVVVVESVHYWLGKNGTKPGPHNGFAGRRWDVEFFDGRTVTTYDLWYQGTIPPKFREALPDNARFVKEPSRG